jgi:hypothetical protein
VITEVDERLRSEARRFELRFRCDDCAHFDPETAACGNGWETATLRGLRLATATEIGFCKEFELGA